MISVIESPSRKDCFSIYRLRVVLLGVKPPLWRRLYVPGNAALDWLHAVLQVALGWTNSHLHQFIVGDAFYSDTHHQLAEFEDDRKDLEERKFTLQQIAPSQKDVFGYEYDFGDCWEHEITVEQILPSDSAPASIARCLGGARACPPEDCGGASGYDDLLEVLKKPKHPEHERMKEWLGRPFDPEEFDAEKVNLWLRKLSWPHVTEGRLRKVLMGRDDYHE